MSACSSVPAFGPIARWGPKKRSALKRSEKLGLGFLLLSLLVCLATRGAVGAELIVAAIFCSFFLLPLEYVAGSLALGPLLPLVLAALPPWYVGYARWFLVFGGTAIVCFRARQSRRAFGSARVSLFRALFVAHVAVAWVTVLTSTAPSLSAAKCLVLLAGLVSFGSYSAWLVRAKGGSAAAVFVRGWLFILSPILIANVAARLWGLEGITAGSSFRGLAGNANSLGVTLALALPLLVCQFLYRRRRNSLLMQGYGILLVASLALLYASWSRASIGAFVVGVAVLFWIHPINRLNRFAVLGALLLLAAFFMGPQDALESLESWLYKGRAEEKLLAARSQQWQLGYQSFLERPLLGGGYGVTAAREDEWALDNFQYLKIEQGSSLFALLGQVGLLGSVPFYLGIIGLLLRSLHYARRVRDPWLSGIVASASVGFVNSFFEGWMAAPGSGLFWLVVFQFFFLDAVMSNLKPMGRPFPFPKAQYPTPALRYQGAAPSYRPAVAAGRVSSH